MARESYFRRLIPRRQPRRSFLWLIVMLIAIILLIVYLQRVVT
ncbi:hypothetical protein ACFL5D_03875 [Candidatus Neomarinimicrobiota bacterium]